jgi:hypothetical protein
MLFLEAKLPSEAVFFSQPLKKAMSRVFFPAASFSRSKASLEKKLLLFLFF